MLASVVWCGVVWCAVVWCGVVWCGVVWCGVVWCGVVWCGVVWCGVVWCVCCVMCCGEKCNLCTKNVKLCAFFCGKCMYLFFAVSRVNYKKKKKLKNGRNASFARHVQYVQLPVPYGTP